MYGIERKWVEALERHRHIAFFVSISILGFIVRFTGRNFVSNDMADFLIPWFEQIKENGNLRSLDTQVGNYNILYQTLIACITYLEGNVLYYYKAISIIFDFLLAFYCSRFICELTKAEKMGFLFNIIYATVLFMPTVILNSAFWGQCDSIYTFFIVLTLFYLYKKKYVRTFVYLGLAFAFKFQAILILPFIISYYLYKKDFSIINFLISVVTFWLTGILAYLQGRNILAPFTIYSDQTRTYPYMYLNVNSFWVLIGNNYEAFHLMAIILTLVLCGLGLYAILSNYKLMNSLEQYLNTACWFVWTCLLFLPAMHERYTYVLDLLLVLLSFIDKKYIKYAVLSNLLSFITYGIYLVRGMEANLWYVLLYIVAWIYYTYTILKQDESERLSINN